MAVVRSSMLRITLRPYSFHAGGIDALRCDGSVTFLADSTSAAVFMAFVTKAGGETLSIN
jgi:hypothetical protein